VAWVRTALLCDIILGLLMVEGVIFSRGRSRTERAALASFLAAGAGFTLALRALLVGWPTWSFALALAVAGLAHLAHLRGLLR
jgi:hypothetical protein